jgi:predicted Fe-Mo cluster-binding NifX family protein
MTLISLEADKTSISKRFRKANYFALLEQNEVSIIKNEHKTSKSKEIFVYFNTLNVQKIYVKELGYKTFLKLQALGIKVYFIDNVENYIDIQKRHLRLIDHRNAKNLCTLGHHNTSK